MRKLLNLFCNCGVTKEEYLSVRDEALKKNYEVWRYIGILGAVINTVLFIESLGSIEDGFVHFGRFFIMVYSIVVTILFFTVFKKSSTLTQIIICVTIGLHFLTHFIIGLQISNMMSVSFIVMLVLLPVLIIDRPCYMALALFVVTACFCYATSQVKAATPLAVRGDIINAVTYSLLGVGINTYYNAIRIRTFLLAKQKAEHIKAQEAAMEKAESLNATLQKMSENLIEVMGNVVESRDSDSGSHIQRVKGYTNILAKQIKQDMPQYGLNDYQIKLMTFASALHDVGKIAIPDRVLLKPEKLTDEEFAIMKTHCQKGCDIVTQMKGSWSEEYMQMATDVCLYHHEKWDGKGYPAGLKGDEIPISAQIVSIADIYDALTTKRVYKDAYSPEIAFRMIIDGECGRFSDGMMACFRKCREQFETLAADPNAWQMEEHSFDVIAQGKGTISKFVIDLHDNDKNLQDKLKLSEELSIISGLSEHFLYIAYVSLAENKMHQFKAEENIATIMNSFGTELPCHELFDRLMNTIVVADDIERVRTATNRDDAMAELQKSGHLSCSFRIRLQDGVHYCRLRMTMDKDSSDAVIVGVMNVDEEHKRELEQVRLQTELERTKLEMQDREKLEDQLAVISLISSEYDYVCSLNAENFQITEYHTEPWIRDMLKDMEDIVKSPEARDNRLHGIVHPDDFEAFAEASRHENVVKGLRENNGFYEVNYRGYKFGKLMDYQTRYILDKEHPHRIIIGLRSTERL